MHCSSVKHGVNRDIYHEDVDYNESPYIRLKAELGSYRFMTTTAIDLEKVDDHSVCFHAMTCTVELGHSVNNVYSIR